MPYLTVNHPDKSSERVELDRARLTIGRSARNEVCIADPFASRVHVEVRRESDRFFMQDLGSANGTLFNGVPCRSSVPLAHGDRIRIGETEIIFNEENKAMMSGARMVTTDEVMASTPELTLALSSNQRTTSGLLEAIEGVRAQVSAQKSAQVAAPAVRRQDDLLALISKVSVTLLSSATLNEILERIVALVFESVPADRCIILLRDADGEELKMRVARLRDQQQDTNVGEIRVSRTVIEDVMHKGQSVLTADAMQDEHLASNTMMLQGIRSVMAVPLGVGDNLFGLIYADSPLAGGRFERDHLEVLTMLASVAATRVENARLLEERMERERMERELQLASEIQQGLLPSGAPQVTGYDLLGISFPCYEIGGDYYDFIKRADGHWLVALGDVSGKGTAAALLMSSLHAAIHAQTAAEISLTGSITAVNRYLAESTPANRFVTFFYTELDPADGTLKFINAGHNPPFIARADGTLEHLDSSGLPLGMFATCAYTEGQTALGEGDVLVIFSDGVSEAICPTGDEFGCERLQQIIQENLHLTAAGMRDKVEGALTQWADGTPANDDITLVILKRAATQSAVA